MTLVIFYDACQDGLSTAIANAGFTPILSLLTRLTHADKGEIKQTWAMSYNQPARVKTTAT